MCHIFWCCYFFVVLHCYYAMHNMDSVSCPFVGLVHYSL